MLVALVGTTVGYPLAHERGLAETSRSRQQCEFAFQAGIKPGKQAWTCDERGIQTGQTEFGCKQWPVLPTLPGWRGGNWTRHRSLKYCTHLFCWRPHLKLGNHSSLRA